MGGNVKKGIHKVFFTRKSDEKIHGIDSHDLGLLDSDHNNGKIEWVNNDNVLQKRVDAAINEYSLMHDRVFKNNDNFQNFSIQILLLQVSILYFCIKSFSDPEFSFYVNIGMILVIITMSFMIISMGIINSTKIIYFGRYMIFIQMRINRLLLLETKSSEKVHQKAVDWETWRIKHGLKNGLSLTLDGAFPIFIQFLIAFLSAFYRLSYLYEFELEMDNGQSWFAIYLIVLVLLIMIYGSMVMILFSINSKAKKINEDLLKDETDEHYVK